VSSYFRIFAGTFGIARRFVDRADSDAAAFLDAGTPTHRFNSAEA
jgi:hypothetical protein